jgi:hypothetical protein
MVLAPRRAATNRDLKFYAELKDSMLVKQLDQLGKTLAAKGDGGHQVVRWAQTRETEREWIREFNLPVEYSASAREKVDSRCFEGQMAQVSEMSTFEAFAFRGSCSSLAKPKPSKQDLRGRKADSSQSQTSSPQSLRADERIQAPRLRLALRPRRLHKVCEGERAANRKNYDLGLAQIPRPRQMNLYIFFVLLWLVPSHPTISRARRGCASPTAAVRGTRSRSAPSVRRAPRESASPTVRARPTRYFFRRPFLVAHCD